MQAILFALISYVGWGTGDVFGTIATRKLGSYAATVWSCIFRVLFFGLFIPFFWHDFFKYSPLLFLFNLFLGVILLGGFFMFNEALTIGNPALVGVITNSFPALVWVLSIIFLHEQISLWQALATLAIFCGILIVGIDMKLLKVKISVQHKALLLALFTFICWGIYFTFIKIPVKTVGWYWPNYLAFVTFPILLLFMKIKKIRLGNPNKKGAFSFVFIALLLTGIAEYSFNFAISKGLTAVVAPIAGSSPTLFFVISSLVFKEPIKKQQFIGIFIVLIGIVALSFLSA